MPKLRWLSLATYIATIVMANWLIAHLGLVPVGFGLSAPAGVYAAGLSLTCRDWVQEQLGRTWSVAAILAGGFLSWWIAPAFALASAGAFLVSELADFAVYTPLRERSWLGAIAISNTVGLAIDSVLFLSLAFGSLDFLAGQIWGKLWMTLLAVAVLALVRRRRVHVSRAADAVAG